MNIFVLSKDEGDILWDRLNQADCISDATTISLVLVGWACDHIQKGHSGRGFVLPNSDDYCEIERLLIAEVVCDAVEGSIMACDTMVRNEKHRLERILAGKRLAKTIQFWLKEFTGETRQINFPEK
jgi:hypothetical protein